MRFLKIYICFFRQAWYILPVRKKKILLLLGNGKMVGFSGRNYLKWYYALPTITKCVGVFDKYSTGVVRHIDFCGECIVVWVEFNMMTKAYSYK